MKHIIPTEILQEIVNYLSTRPFNATSRNDGGHFNTETGLFTAPTTAGYSFSTLVTYLGDALSPNTSTGYSSFSRFFVGT